MKMTPRNMLEIIALLPNFALLDEFRVEAASLLEIIAKCIEIEAGTTALEWALVDGMVVRRGRLFILATATTWV
jgi:hypothetical protein